MSAAAAIHVCQAGPCRNAGSEAVLLEIEELAAGLGRCTVQPSGCLGNCSQAPNAIIVKAGRESICPRIRDLNKSAEVVQQATGIAPDMEDPERKQRLTDARQLRIRDEARKSGKWNTGLKGFAEQIERSKGNQRLQLQFEHARLLASAGQLDLALKNMDEITRLIPDEIQVCAEFAQILGKLGRKDEVDVIRKRFVEELGFDSFRVSQAFGKCEAEDTSKTNGQHRIENYSMWQLDGITVVSKHSAIYHLTTKDRKRGTPNPRGAGRSRPVPKTWHTTLLGEVGTNAEGPLPWIERDYTPISTAKEWESGKVDILIKIYEKGLATSWLHKKTVGCNVWLSQPARTLCVPSFVAEIGDVKLLQSASVLLLLAGSGIVVASQVLQHQDPLKNIGIQTPGLQVPVNLIYSCRKDDICMTNDLTAWCKLGLTSNGQKGLLACTLLLTEPQSGATTPFPEAMEAENEEFSHLSNASVSHARLSTELLGKEVSAMRSPCRIVVSGPESYNAAVRNMLLSVGVDKDAITILEA